MLSKQTPLFTQARSVGKTADESMPDTVPLGSIVPSVPEPGAGCERSSGVEHRLHTAGVRGSKPRARTITTRPIPEIGRSDRRRFWAKVQRRLPDDCWLWTGASGEGYGRFKIAGYLYSAHRIAYTLEKGPIPRGDGYHGFVVMHSCDTPACCNPAHLSVGTNRDNVQDMVAKGRHPSKKTTIAKIPPEIIRQICERDVCARALGREFNIDPHYINDVRRIHGIPIMIHRNRHRAARPAA